MQQDVCGWFDTSVEPFAKHGKPLLILIGKHARLSNIGDEGRFVRDEAFLCAGEPILRQAGTSAKGLMRSWVTLRQQNPIAAESLRDIEICQQPAGFQDAIISKWRIECLALEGAPQSLHSRDLNAS